jgi:hypothetical protein
MASIALRDASDAELASVFRASADHIIGTVDGTPVVYVRLQTVDGRRWGTINMLNTISKASVLPMFLALKRRLQQEREPIYATATNWESARLLRLIGLVPTEETAVGKQVWVWTPA